MLFVEFSIMTLNESCTDPLVTTRVPASNGITSESTMGEISYSLYPKLAHLEKATSLDLVYLGGWSYRCN